MAIAARLMSPALGSFAALRAVPMLTARSLRWRTGERRPQSSLCLFRKHATERLDVRQGTTAARQATNRLRYLTGDNPQFLLVHLLEMPATLVERHGLTITALRAAVVQATPDERSIGAGIQWPEA